MRRCDFRALLAIAASTLLFPFCTLAADPVTLPVAIRAAIDADPWLERNETLEASFYADAVAAGALPDPKLSASIANLPTDSFSFSQEPMTQIKLGLTQAIPDTESRRLARKRLQQMGEQSPYQRADRTARLTLNVTQAWLTVALAEQSIALVENNRALFEQLVDVTRSSYASVSRRVNQQDLIRAQLELTRLDERVLRLKQQRAAALGQLAEWVPLSMLTGPVDWEVSTMQPASGGVPIDLTRHPAIRVLDQQIEIARTGLQLSEASTRPGWSVQAGYAYRDEDRSGRSLPDFVSVGVTVDLPLFTTHRQDQRITAAAKRASAAESSRLLALQRMSAEATELEATLARLTDQADLYDKTLLQQLDSLSESALNAYTAAEGDFADVMRAYIAALNARIEVLRIRTDINITTAKLAYLATEANNHSGV